ncbi:Glutathione S-transferase protein [Moelleriella libera RCEF 2490]|uniref:Glutathione S-transferase protein n=1 Tax=Moelleriella libera RCEF 2490 TaxID=1081109 RepID=A0A166VM60_9HYPO|nr:Glutathione S-transferase protein [Moelleriella libera RCEF 2490]
MAIGRDVYLDSRLQLQKLERLKVSSSSSPCLGAGVADQRAIERLLSSLMTDAGVFGWAASLLPADLPLLQDPVFAKDREDYSGIRRTAERDARTRPTALREVALVFDLLETTLLADDRDWILKTPQPSLADIEAVWPLHWLVSIPSALPTEKFSSAVYPKVYAWIQRFDETVRAAKKKMGQKPLVLSGEEASRMLVGSAYHEPSSEIEVDETDFEVRSLGLKRGDRITVGPTDFGSSGRDEGVLVGMTAQEVVYETRGEDGVVRVHAPRHGFRIRKGRTGVELKL